LIVHAGVMLLRDARQRRGKLQSSTHNSCCSCTWTPKHRCAADMPDVWLEAALKVAAHAYNPALIQSSLLLQQLPAKVPASAQPPPATSTQYWLP
jgi:hypothetical protein